MKQTNNHDNKRLSQWTIALCALTFLLISTDIIDDYQDGIAWWHIIIEVMILLFSLAGTLYFGWIYFATTQATIHRLEQDLTLANQDAQQWLEVNKNLLAGLAKQILKQFTEWQLTPAEIEVGMLLLKGLSHQAIADLRAASERTIRDQARAIYRKSGLCGRSDLSAFFLEDLLLPHQSR